MASPLWTVAGHLDGKPPIVVDLYERFVRLVEACGPFDCAVGKSEITFRGQGRIFATARPTRHALDGTLIVPWRIEDPRIRLVQVHTRTLRGNHFRLTDAEQLDDRFAAWIGAAYQAGAGSPTPS
jgi:hypothetical protein